MRMVFSCKAILCVFLAYLLLFRGRTYLMLRGDEESGAVENTHLVKKRMESHLSRGRTEKRNA